MKLVVLKQNIPISEVSVDTTDETERYEIFVGRSEDCHVRIDDPLVSRHHLVLRRNSEGWTCERLSQVGVVTLNGSLITLASVQNGDEIKFGSYSVFVSELGSSSRERPSQEKSSPPVVAEEPAYPELEDLASIATPEVTPLEKTDVMEETQEEDQVLEENYSEIEAAPEPSLESLDGTQEEEPLETFSQDFNEDINQTEDFSSGVQSENFEMIEANENENEGTQFFKTFVSYQLILFGEHAPYDRYQIDREEVFIGRDPKKCQIILNDPEVSSVHAVVRKNNTEIILEDLNSSNGTILNGERINKAEISAGDEFVIGATSFTLEVKSDLLESEADRLMPVASDQVVETEEVIEEEVGADGEISFDQDAPPEKSIIKRIMKDPVKRKKTIYAAAVIAILMLLLDDSEEEVNTKPAPKKQAQAKPVEGPKLSKELQNARDVAYELGVSYFEQNRLDMAQIEFQKVVGIDPKYKNVQSYFEQTNTALKRLEELEAQRKAQEEKIQLKKIVEELLVKAREAVKERQVKVAESFFSQIAEKDPENIEVTQLRLELEEWQKEEERKALEKAAKEAARKKMVDGLNPGKTFYLKKEWYRAILKLEEFLRAQGMDEDLVKEASDMLSDAKNQLASELGPLLGKARSLKEGQDLKSAYEAFLEILKVEPTNSEALNEVDDIKTQLDGRSKRIYREAIIAESLSLFGDAKEKFLEVQQISPTDSEYYKKASEKLKNYLE